MQSNQHCLNLEVPLVSPGLLDSTAAVINVETSDPLFDIFPGAAAGTRIPPGGPLPVTLPGSDPSHVVSWNVDSDEPNKLYIQDISLNNSSNDSCIILTCSAGIITPSVSCIWCSAASHGGDCSRLAFLTADGSLHIGTIKGTKVLDNKQNVERIGLPQQFSKHPVQSTLLVSAFRQSGAPTTMAQANDCIYIGTDQGNVLCVPVIHRDDVLVMGDVVELKYASSGVAGILGGLFSRSGHGSAIRHVVYLKYTGLKEDSFVISIDDSFNLRVWHPSSKQMVFETSLVPPEERRLMPSLVRLIADPLDSNTTNLLLCTEPIDGNGSASIRCFDITIEERGDELYKILVQGGSRLVAPFIKKVIDVVLEYRGAKSLIAWILYANSKGKKALCCTPVVYGDAEKVGLDVKLIEDQVVIDEIISSGCGLPSSLQDSLGLAFLEACMAPGRLSRVALLIALKAIGRPLDPSIQQQEDLGVLKDAIQRSIGDDDTLWHRFTLHYSEAFSREHAPVALLHLPVLSALDDGHHVLIARRRGGVSMVRTGLCVEYPGAVGALSAQWTLRHQIPGVEAVLAAASAVMEVCGGKAMSRIVWTAMQQGKDLGGLLVPDVISGLVSGNANPASEATCLQRRQLPLVVSGHLSHCDFVQCMGNVLNSMRLEVEKSLRTPHSGDLSKVSVLATIATITQVTEAVLTGTVELLMLSHYVYTHRQLGEWCLSPEDGVVLVSEIIPRAISVSISACTAHWAAVTPSSPVTDSTDIDPSRLVMLIELGDGSAHKRPRISSAADTFALETVLRSLMKGETHAVRCLQDLQSLALYCTGRLIGVLKHGDSCSTSVAAESARSVQGGLLLAAQLFAKKKGKELSALVAIPKANLEGENIAIMFFDACGEAQQKNHCSALLFMRVGQSMSAQDRQETSIVMKSVAALRHDLEGEEVQMHVNASLFYYETVAMYYYRLGLYALASQFALAALQVGDKEENDLKSSQLLTIVFNAHVEGRQFQEAYAAMIAIPVAEVKCDCLHKLIIVLCTEEETKLLCQLPFSGMVLLSRGGGGKKVWVPLLEEALSVIRQKADGSEVSIRSHLYKVLYTVYARRGEYQAAAEAMYLFAKRLLLEKASHTECLREAESALQIAVSTLSYVQTDQQWLEDTTVFPCSILPMSSLEKELAKATALKAISERLPAVGGVISQKADDVLQQLMSLGLFDEAFSMAEHVYEGSKLTRAFEKIAACLASHCVVLQKDWATRGSDAAVAWQLLRKILEMLENRYPANTRQLRLVAIEAILATEPEFGVPHWLLEPYLRARGPAELSGALPDVPGLLRLFMKHSRYEDATDVVCKQLETVVVRNVPSIAFSKMTSVYFPAQLLNLLLGRLEQVEGEEARRAAERLQRLMNEERVLSNRQTDVISQVYQ